MPSPTPRTRRHRRRRSLLIAATALTATALAPATAASAAPAVLGTPVLTAPATAEVGDVITVELRTDAAGDLYAYELELSYDPALLAPVEDSVALPDGGHSSALVDDDATSVTHTRLGTSPGLSGEQSLVSIDFTTLAAGDAAVTLTGGETVGTELERTAVDDELSAVTAIAEPSSTGADAGADGADAGSDGGSNGTADAGSDGADGSGSSGDDSAAAADATPSPTAAPAADTPLADTGAQAGAIAAAAALAVALLALGAVLVARRRGAE
ncbi:cohesin domain-containing protein [Mycetocola reblochoni]|uniref:Alpha-1,2-mannosidase n=3 Tax=Mycetocola reblochoni TaxID=331618 RepID=A0A1R4J7Z7_9MICO|nr:cohesin domain-containing protein [Mycetocola reblochoni]RLP71123.1 hypothetical protein D9V30_01520 [Mycetocola reblochoni]SJN28152.1 Alpha-1,2-mannosidase [Mycetocola reblochoni REB411]